MAKFNISHPDEDSELWVFSEGGQIKINIGELAVCNGINLSLQEAISVRDALDTLILEMGGKS